MKENKKSNWDLYKEQAENSELFIGVVGATGTDLKMIELALADALREVRYSPSVIKISLLLEEQFETEKFVSEFNRIRNAMELGNKIRSISKDASATLAILEVRRLREQYWTANSIRLPPNTKQEDFAKIPLVRHAYIFHSLKTPAEVEILREIYGESFYVISAYSSRANRKIALEKRIAESEIGIMQFDRRSKKADLLMRRDYVEAELPQGQNLRDTFPLADLFINADEIEGCKFAIKRFVRMIFGDTTQTPTIDEYCMFHAKGAALRSGDLGRQVGATIATTSGDILSHGTNEAPKAHGGQFWTGDAPDGRGVAQKSDVSDIRKKSLFVDLLQRLSNHERIEQLTKTQISNLADEVFSSNRPAWMKGAELLELIGFYRSVHGETAAIINAARLGISVRGTNLYVTAFPCHECTRHILAAGVERVFYIEPYPKSLAGVHYPESIVIDEVPNQDQISFTQFVGVAPRVYLRFFEALERKKKDGSVIKWQPETCSLRYHHHHLAYTTKETNFAAQFMSK